jgi:3-hydroxyacyl-[acyl-carrier-protein] dehydratase
MRWKLVDSIEEVEIGSSIQGRKTFSEEEEFFQDHFPNFPVVPGVLIMESLAQLSGKLIGYTVRQQRGDWPFPILSMMHNVKFRKFIRPNECITLQSEIQDLQAESCRVKVKARIGKKVHAQAEQIFVFNAIPLDNELEQRHVENLERQELCRLWKDCPDNHNSET